ncbi:MAG TPA: bL35 family ribosomal protein [Candidatus Tyrphobacter sp.]|nr:bL35 family ribosomal protein [Candidatus Tyrphobacter sp.]
MKTRKSFSKRIKITKTGKLLHRTPGLTHFRAVKPRDLIRRRRGEKIMGRGCFEKLKSINQ